MPEGEQRVRMRLMRGLVQEFNVYRWAGRMLIDAARIRGGSRLQERRHAARMATTNGETPGAMAR
jgi:trehalose 6-phosphate synthase